MYLTQIPTACFKRTFLRTVHKHVSGNLSELCNNFQSFIKALLKTNKQKTCDILSNFAVCTPPYQWRLVREPELKPGKKKSYSSVGRESSKWPFYIGCRVLFYSSAPLSLQFALFSKESLPESQFPSVLLSLTSGNSRPTPYLGACPPQPSSHYELVGPPPSQFALWKDRPCYRAIFNYLSIY